VASCNKYCDHLKDSTCEIVGGPPPLGEECSWAPEPKSFASFMLCDVHPVRRLSIKLVEDSKEEQMSLWWLSFADPNRPQGRQFLGAAIVRALDFVGAVSSAHALECNPGGEVKGLELPRDLEERIPKDYVGVLLSKEQCMKFDKIIGGSGEVRQWE